MRWLLVACALAGCGGPQPPIMQGSQKDTDGDGIRDIDDKCAYVPGPGTRDGCPEKQSTINVDEGPGPTDAGAVDSAAVDDAGSASAP